MSGRTSRNVVSLIAQKGNQHGSQGFWLTFYRCVLSFCCPKAVGSLLDLLHAVYPENKVLPVIKLKLL